jgi:hypothetical protein
MRAILCLACLLTGCARAWVNYPPQVDPATGKVYAARAVEFNGADVLGGTVVTVTNNSVRVSSEGGVDTSTSTREGYRTARAGITAATTLGLAGAAAAAYGSEQSAVAASNVAASRAAAATAASRNATTVRLAEIEAARALATPVAP